MTLIPDSSNKTAHTRARTILGYTVPDSDVKLETVNMTSDEFVEIMNRATDDSEVQLSKCLSGEKYAEPDIGIKSFIKISKVKRCTGKNIGTMVNLYAHGGRTTLPPSSRLSGRQTGHHLGYFTYSQKCSIGCNMLIPGNTIQYKRVITNKNKKRVKHTFRGNIVFLSYFKGKSAYALLAWCQHIYISCICWLRD